MMGLSLMMIKSAVKYFLKDLNLTVMPLHLTTLPFTHVASYLRSVPKSHSSSSHCCAKKKKKRRWRISTSTLISCLCLFSTTKKTLYKVCVIKIVFFKSDNPERKPTKHVTIVPVRKRQHPFRIYIHKHLDSHTLSSGNWDNEYESILYGMRAGSFHEPRNVKVKP